LKVGDFYCSRNVDHGHGGGHHDELTSLRREVDDMRAQLQVVCSQLASAGLDAEFSAQCLLQMPNASLEARDSSVAVPVNGRRLQGKPYPIGECCCCDESRQNEVFSCDPDTWAGQNESGCPDGDKCQDELRCRWKVFNLIGGPHEEAEVHEHNMSTPYVLFETWGTAASVEMYFTICGVLLKVILLTQHPKSDEILDLDAHHHHVDHRTGEHQVVVARPGESKGTVSKISSGSSGSPSGRAESATDPTEVASCSAPAGTGRSSSSQV